MRPPIATSKNDATPALHNQRKTNLNQKGVQVDNKKKPNLQQTNNQEKQKQTPVQATSLINSESDDFLCFKSQPAKFDEFLAKRNSSSSGGSDDINSSVTFFTSCQNYSENVNDTSLQNPNSRKDQISKNLFDGFKVVPTPPLSSSISSSAIKTSSNGITEFNRKCNLTSAEDVPKNLFVNNFEIFNRNYNDNVRVNGVTTDKVATVVSLPLSETAPLLTNIETTLADPKRSICLNKNSASLIFTKKDCNSATSLNNKNCNNTSNSFVQRLSSVTNNNSSSVGAKCETKRNNNNNSRNSNVNNNNSNSNISNRNKNSNLNIQHRQSLQVNYFPIINRDSSNNTSNNCAPNRSSTASTNRRQHAYSWYAPVYSALEEEFEQESRDSSPIHKVAETQNPSVAGNEVLETSSLLNPSTNTTTIGQPQLHHPRIRRQTSNSSANQVVTQAKSNNNVNLTNQTQIVYNEPEGPHATSLLGGPLPRRKRFENFLKSLVGRKPSKDPNTNTTLLPSPELKVSHSPSEHSLLRENNSGHDKITSSTLSLNSVQQKLWNVVPLLKREGSVTSLHQEKSNPLVQYSGLRKCETVLALSRSTVSVEPIKPQNRLRNSSSTSNANCSRCSSLLSLAASGSRYSLNLANSGFVTVNNATHGDNTSCQQQNKLSTVKTSTASICSTTTGGGVGVGLGGAAGLTNTNGVSRFSGKCAANHENSSSANGEAIFNKSTSSSQQNLYQQSSSTTGTAITITASAVISSPCGEIFRCKLCLADVEIVVATTIEQCGCIFCTECMKSYVEFEISEGAYQISCPDAQCPHQGIVSLTEITSLASPASMNKYHRYQLNHEIELDKNRTWCPRAGCETICVVGPAPATSSSSSTEKINLVTQVLCSVQCPTCKEEFCSGCKKPWHPSITCEDNSRRLAAEGQYDFIGIPFDNDLIKYCPMCAVPIEKDEGCAQMMCKRCKHVFCWYCLASLDDDFLLRHYDKGPCKNKLGHSRASVVWHRAQVIGIFAGFGILLLVASPLLLLAAPCIICCKCRICNGSGRLDDPDTDFDDAVALQR